MKKIFCLLVIGLGPIALWAAGGTTSLNFLKIGWGARQAAMGDCGVALADDASTIYWNPAGLANTVGKNIFAQHLEYLLDIKYDVLAYSQQYHQVFIGGAAGYLYTYNIERTRIDLNQQWGYESRGSFGLENRLLLLALAWPYSPDLAFGLGLKYLQEKIDTDQAAGLALDTGLLLAKDNWQFGFSIANLGGSVKFIQVNESLPVIIRTGVSYCWRDRLILTSSLAWPLDYQQAINGGLEYRIYDWIFVRGGFRLQDLFNDDYLDEASKFTLGLGIKFLNYQLDYAFIPYGGLGNTSRISFLAKF